MLNCERKDAGRMGEGGESDDRRAVRRGAKNRSLGMPKRPLTAGRVSNQDERVKM
jgi:hypothetical protein